MAGCLLLPRPLLYAAASQRLDATQIAQSYGVSEQMAAFRLRTTGVMRPTPDAFRDRANRMAEDSPSGKSQYVV